MARTILIVGASAGIGALCAEKLVAKGHAVHAASRRGAAPPGCVALGMDVDDDESVARAVSAVLGSAGRIDGLVFCAGWGLAGAIEDTTPQEARAQFETLFFGAHRVCRAVLPSMRARGSGRIVLVSSLVAEMPIPYQAFYSAAKAALASYAEALALECRPFGIDVVDLQPGNFRTEFTDARRRVAAWTTGSAHAHAAEASIAWMSNDERKAPAPDAVARRVCEVLVATRRPRVHQPIANVVERGGVWLRGLLPQRAYLAIASRVFRVTGR